ncbi:ion transporter [Methanobrevibacter sp.]|uniref:potassium channel family protein n=1 Tax=Methanobrevibacter sp. TaxID=66852 RepID=UPI0025D78087|nr:ion transporter [Methanobrevibacter sp.]MBR4448182.1 ion transporter [Methanobrevibacter sp.]
MGENKKQLVYLALIFLTVLDVLLMAYVLVHPSYLALRYNVFAFDLIVCVLLWIEFIYSYLHASNKKEYLKHNSISILGMLPIDFIFFRALRLIKLIQLIKLFALARETEGKISKFLKQTYLDKIIVAMIIFVFSITVLINIVDSNVNDILTALWYTIVSMTSTGYGDVIPATNLGKLIGMFAMVGGILIFASITAVISSLYMSRISKDNQDELKSKIDELNSEIEKLNKKIDDL